jgi:aryl sulfotransferase
VGRVEPIERPPLREYKNPISNCARWEGFVHRSGDIFVCTPPKAGTTWMQSIVAALLWPAGNAPGSLVVICPWIEARFEPIDAVLARLDAQPHRRAMKTHAPPTAIPWFPTASYVAVGRDWRDALMSRDNHLRHLRPDVIGDGSDEPGPPPYSGDVHELFETMLADASYLTIIGEWWERRHEPNVLLVHFNDLKADLESEMRRVAGFLDIEIADATWPELVQRCTFEGMRGRSAEISDFARFDGGAESFLFKGTNERWRGVLTDDELARYESRVAELLPPDAVAWLENGGLLSGGTSTGV